jgi:hypothetical protein
MTLNDFSIELEIDYDNEALTSRKVSVFGYEWNEKKTAVVIHGFCHLRSSERSFNSRKIVRCVNLTNNQEISDIARFFRMIEGLPEPIEEEAIVLPLTRSNDVGGFRRRFRPEILYYQFKLNFFGLFDNKCFKCKKLATWVMYPESDEIMGGLLAQKQLVIDHHVALENGGRYQPGNLVSLCQKCNSRKHTMKPEDFYNDQELAKLQPYLIVQEDIFPPDGKYWAWKKYERFIDGDIDAKRMMLRDENIDPNLIEICLTNASHYCYCGWRRADTSKSSAVLQVSINIDTQQSKDEAFNSLLELISPTLFTGKNYAIDGSAGLLSFEQVSEIIKRGGGSIVDLRSPSIDFIIRGSKPEPSSGYVCAEVLSHSDLLMLLMNR